MGGNGPDHYWTRIVTTLAEHDSLPDAEVEIIEKAIFREMARRVLRDPEAGPSFVAAQPAVFLASAAWNVAV